MSGSALTALSSYWMITMARILKNIVISDECIPLGLVQASVSERSPLHAEPVKDEVNINDTEIVKQTRYAQGFSDGVAQERAMLSQHTSTLVRLIHSIPQSIIDNRQQLSSDIADMVLLIVSKFFIHQQQNREAIVHQINQVIMQLNEKQHLSVALHPHDLALLKQGEIKFDFKDHQQLQFTADDQLRLGGCIVTSEHGVFDAGIERQIDQLKDILLRMKSQHE